MLVIAIMAVLLTFLAPSMIGPLSATTLTSTASTVASELQAARQVALTRNVEVEVQFYSEEGAIRRFGTFRLLDDGSREPIAAPTKLNEGTVISEDSAITKIGSPASGRGIVLPESIPVGTPTYKFSFLPDGSTNLSLSEKWYLTVIKDGATETPPNNFATIQIGPLTGSVKVHRP